MQKQILVVEDDIDLSQMIKYLLEENNYTVVVANNADGFVQSTENNKFDLMLIDIILPDASGADLIKNLKASGKHKDIPIIFLSGLVSNDDNSLDSDRILVDGEYYALIPKPFESRHLLKTIDDVI